MSCSTCLQAKNLPSCLLTLTIGTASANTDYSVKCLCSNGRIDLFPVTTDGAGLIVLNTAYISFLNLTYRISLHDENTNEEVPFSVDGREVTCIEVLFEDVYSDTPITNATIKAK